MSIFHLPVDILREIRGYCELGELYAASNWFLKCRRYVETIHIRNLDVPRFIRFPMLRNHLRSLVEHERQIELTSWNSGIDVPDVSALGRLGAVSLNYSKVGNDELGALQCVRWLNLYGAANLWDANMFKYVHTLSLAQCKQISDVSLLGNVHDLNLSGTNVSDVSMLGKIHKLCLDGCSKIRDVSALGSVHTLSLYSCKNVVDVSALGGVHTLDLGSNLQIINVSALSNVHTLNLSNTGVVDVSTLGGVHTLNLADTGVVGVSALGGVHTLNLSDSDVTNVSALGRVHNLTLAGCTNVRSETFAALGGNHRLNLAECDITNVSNLASVHTLILANTHVSDVSMLGNVFDLNLRNCHHVTDISALANVHKLVL